MSLTQLDPIEDRVERGAAMLDELFKSPKWATFVNVDELVVGDHRRDVLGQIYGNSYHGRAKLGIGEQEALWGGFKLTYDEVSRLFATLWKRGVRADTHLRVHDELTLAWRMQVRKRLGEDVDAWDHVR